MFMKAYQLKLRAVESLVQAANEMQRIPHSFGSISDQWTHRSALPANSPGHTAFARAHAAEWRQRALSAQSRFDDLLIEFPPPDDLPIALLLLRPDYKYS